MREILFKAKGQTTGKWFEGLLVYFCQDVCRIKDKYHEEWVCDSSTLCQYTGLTDKNGRKIWENNIVETPYRRFVVTYTDGVWGDEDGVAMRESIFGEGGTVIGNIFDNPDLLEQEESAE